MNWYYTITWWEYGLIGFFILFYVLYLIRVTRKARQMRSYTSGLAAKMMLRTGYFSLIIIGLLGPTFGSLRKEVKAIGRDIYLVVDLSQSMGATDILPSRLERIKYELSHWIRAFSSDRIGLIVFGDDAFVQCPLTYDQNALQLFIETLNTNLVGRGSTNIGGALQMAIQRHMDKKNTSTRNQAKIIVLISDGEDFGDELRPIAESVEENGLKLFTVGIGTRAGGKIPLGNGFKKNRSGKTVTTRLNNETLQQLASQTKGKYFEVSRTQNEMQKLAGAVSRVEGKLQDTRKLDISANKFYYFLIAALMLIVMDIMIAITTIHL